MDFEYVVIVDEEPSERTYRRERKLAEREVIALGGGLQVVVDAIESEPSPEQAGRVRAHTLVRIIHGG